MDNQQDDDIDSVVPTTHSAARVVELVKRYGRGYAGGELDHVGRGKALTGSEIPTICGENRFERPSSVMFKKAFDMKIADSEAMRHGRTCEPIAISRFKRQSGAKVFFVGFMVHPLYTFIGGTFDALAIMPSGEGVLVEIKCPFSRSICDRVPEHYIGQVQVYMEIAGLDDCMFVQYKPPYDTPSKGLHRPEKLSIVRVKRDATYFGLRMPVLWKFWKRLCSFRAGILPRAECAATLIQRFWRTHRNHPSPSVSDVLVRHRLQRREYDGIYDGHMQDMERLECPTMPRCPLPPDAELCIIDVPGCKRDREVKLDIIIM